ncbi:MAG: anaerobic sulfite reductase subunit AsrA [Actinomycetaceae bacterium]|nr:anaerobic sulfite reductase subunit AsrA [Actinomycetaceae bacterium]MDY5855011.1 anaerobic sulfite reductase subunit AsrA [Arcanobacterium sp.]
MAYKLDALEALLLFKTLARTYDIYAPKRFPGEGRYSDTDLIRYAQVSEPGEVVWDQMSDLPAKEVITPIQETIFYFTGDDYRPSPAPTKPRLVFVRPCDINAQSIQDEIFIGNGAQPDYFYKRKRDLVRFAMMECGGGDDTCFCVSMGQNKTDEYSIGCRFNSDGSLDVTVKDPEFEQYFAQADTTDYDFHFVEENKDLTVHIPDLDDRDVRLRLKSHPMWNEYNSRCISCGACTVACPTCTCFVLRDVIWSDDTQVGERRRIAYSCEVPGFDIMAGQREMRGNAAARMRYKVLHKFHDHKARFGTQQMCIGCGRCSTRCPELISLPATVDKVNQAVAEIKAQIAAEAAVSASAEKEA